MGLYHVLGWRGGAVELLSPRPAAATGGAKRGQVMRIDPGSNLIESRTMLAMLRGELPAGEATDGIWFVTAVFAVPAGSAAG